MKLESLVIIYNIDLIFSRSVSGSCGWRSSMSSSRCPSSNLAFPPAAPPAPAHRFTATEGSFVRPQPTPSVRYANRVPLQYDEEEEDEDWTRLYGLCSTDGGTVSAATGRRLSPIRAFGQNHRRTASLDNIIDGIGDGSSATIDGRSRRNRLRPSDNQPVAIAGQPLRSRPSCWSPQRFMSKSTSSSTTKISPEEKMKPSVDDGSSSSALKSKLKSISDKYLKNPVAEMVTNGRDTLTGSLLYRIRNRQPTPAKDGEQDNGTSRSSFRSFSCSTLPSIDDFHRKRLLAASVSASAANASSPSKQQDDLSDSPGSPIVLGREGDSDSGIVSEWSDTSSISESSYIRHFQPCQLLSSWRKPQKVRRSLSPIFQYRAMQANTSVNQVEDSSVIANTSTTSSSAAYETIWPAEDGQPAVAEHNSVLSPDNSAVHLDEDVTPARTSSPAPQNEEEPCDVRRVHTTRIHIEYPSPTECSVPVAAKEVTPSPPLSRPHYLTGSLDRRALSRGAKLASKSDTSGTSVHLIKIERDSENLKAELGIFIAKKKLTRGSVGYLVAHIVPGGLVDRYIICIFNLNLMAHILEFYRDGRLQLDDEIVNVNGRRLRNLSMAQASAVLRLPVPVVEMVVCRGSGGERAKRRSVDDMLQENAATIVLVNGETLPVRWPKEDPCYENVVLPPDGDAVRQIKSLPQYLDDSGVEVSESGSCSSGSHLEADLLERPAATFRGPSQVFKKTLTSPDSDPVGGDDSTGTGATAATSPGKKKSSDFSTLPRRPRTQISHSFYTIVYEKGPGKKSLGFTLVGGIDSPKGPMSFFVKTYVSTLVDNK